MRCNVMGLLRNAAMECRREDPLTAFALLELANNLRTLMRREESLDAFLEAYTGHEGPELEIDRVLPSRPGSASP